MRFLALLLPLPLSGCIVGTVAETAVDVATLPVKAVARGRRPATTSQSEADQKRGREMRKAEEAHGKRAARMGADARAARAPASPARRAPEFAPPRYGRTMRYFLDTEFNGFGGALISLALVPEDGSEEFYVVLDQPARSTRGSSATSCPISTMSPTACARRASPRRGAAGAGRNGSRMTPAPRSSPTGPRTSPNSPMLLVTGPGQMQQCRPGASAASRSPASRTAANSAVPHNALHDARALARPCLDRLGIKPRLRLARRPWFPFRSPATTFRASPDGALYWPAQRRAAGRRPAPRKSELVRAARPVPAAL